MSDISSMAEQVGSLQELVATLIREHRSFPLQIQGLDEGLTNNVDVREVARHFVKLQSDLTAHMVTEEFDFYPVLMERGLFDETVSTIMQQHHELTADLNRMEVSLRAGEMREFKSALDDLSRALGVHQPAEEGKVFPLVA
jgi:Hemerythrin HHE cation binding domain